jgi:hypothetical protein
MDWQNNGNQAPGNGIRPKNVKNVLIQGINRMKAEVLTP